MEKYKFTLEEILKDKEKFAPKKRLVFVNVPVNYYQNLVNLIQEYDYDNFILYTSVDMFRNPNESKDYIVDFSEIDLKEFDKYYNVERNKNYEKGGEKKINTFYDVDALLARLG